MVIQIMSQKWPEFVVVQSNMTENYWLEKVTDTTKRGKMSVSCVIP